MWSNLSFFMLENQANESPIKGAAFKPGFQLTFSLVGGCSTIWLNVQMRFVRELWGFQTDSFLLSLLNVRGGGGQPTQSNGNSCQVKELILLKNWYKIFKIVAKWLLVFLKLSLFVFDISHHRNYRMFKTIRYPLSKCRVLHVQHRISCW